MPQTFSLDLVVAVDVQIKCLCLLTFFYINHVL